MKVLFITSMYPKPGGTYAGNAIHRQAIALRRRGVDVRVVCPLKRFDRSIRSLLTVSERDEDDKVLPSPEADVSVPVTYFSYPNVPLGISAGAHAVVLQHYMQQILAEVHSTFPFDLVHSHHLFPVGYVACRLARVWGVPCVASAVGSDVHTHPNRNRGIWKRTAATIRQATYVCSVSRALADQISELATPTREVRVVRRGVDTEQFAPTRSSADLRKKLKLPARGIGLSCVSSLAREKGVLELMKAFRMLARIYEDAWLVFVGDGPVRGKLESEVRTSGLESRVFLAGARPHDEIVDWLNATDIFVLASYAEGLPNAVLEAMACARPVVATDVGGIPEAVEDGVTGVLIPPRTVAPLERSLEQLIESAPLRRVMGRTARNFVISNFSWEKSAESLCSLYRDVLKVGGREHATA